jgi:hypothetical protein
MSDFDQTPPPHDLQFQHADVIQPEGAVGSASQLCVACKRPTGNTYYHARGRVVCPLCAQRIQTGQQSPPPLSLARSLLYGAAAALGGSILYAAVAIITGWEFGLVAIVVGYMVGKAIRHGSYGRGGRPQQILAVVLTYFAITTSYIPVFIYQVRQHPEQLAASRPAGTQRPASTRQRQGEAVAAAIVTIVLLAVAAPFFELSTGFSGIISLFLIFIGIRQAWKLTARSEILLMGPYQAAPAA